MLAMRREVVWRAWTADRRAAAASILDIGIKMFFNRKLEVFVFVLFICLWNFGSKAMIEFEEWLAGRDVYIGKYIYNRIGG